MYQIVAAAKAVVASNAPEQRRQVSVGETTVCVQITKGHSSDAEGACVALRRSIAEVCGPDYAQIEGFVEDWLKNKTAETVASWIENPDAYFVVAREFEKETVAGVGSISRSGKVLLCYVVPECLRRGFGYAILKELEDQAQRWGLEKTTALSTVTARDFYARQGYKGFGEPIKECGQEIEYPMEKILVA